MYISQYSSPSWSLLRLQKQNSKFNYDVAKTVRNNIVNSTMYLLKKMVNRLVTMQKCQGTYISEIGDIIIVQCTGLDVSIIDKLYRHQLYHILLVDVSWCIYIWRKSCNIKMHNAILLNTLGYHVKAKSASKTICAMTCICSM
jgi:hypothetical protein